MKLFNITDVYDNHTGWSMMEQSVMSFCNLSWHQVIYRVNVLETLYVKYTILRFVASSQLVVHKLTYSHWVSTSDLFILWPLYLHKVLGDHLWVSTRIFVVDNMMVLLCSIDITDTPNMA